jgi:hypothetical protein
MTLLDEIQTVWEQTYAPIGLNLSACLIGPSRCRELTRLAGPDADALSPSGRTFLRRAGNALYLAIFYADPIIAELEKNDPRCQLNERNISPLITFIEEITHGLQAALLFQEGVSSFDSAFDSEDFFRNLEAQAKVDTYLILHRFTRLLCAGQPPTRVQHWIEEQLFDTSHERFSQPHLCERYRMAQTVAHAFLRELKKTNRHRRHALLQEFRAMTWPEKRQRTTQA